MVLLMSPRNGKVQSISPLLRFFACHFICSLFRVDGGYAPALELRRVCLEYSVGMEVLIGMKRIPLWFISFILLLCLIMYCILLMVSVSLLCGFGDKREYSAIWEDTW